MEYLKLNEGFAINKKSIVTVKASKKGTLITTAVGNFEIEQSFNKILKILEEDAHREREVSKLTTQFFGG